MRRKTGSRLRDNVGAALDKELESFPTTAVIKAIDGAYADIQLGNSTSYIRHCDIIGDPASLSVDQEVSIKWDQNKGSYPRPVVIASEGGTAGTVTNVYYQGSMAHDHPEYLIANGWQTTSDGTLFNLNTSLTKDGTITLGVAPNYIKLSSIHATYRLWAGAVDPASAPFSVSKTGAIVATSGDIGGWNIGSDYLSADSGNTELKSSVPSIRLGATDYTTGDGIWMGYHSTLYKMRIGDATGDTNAQFLQWDGADLTISGSVRSDDYVSGVTGWAIDANGDAEFSNVRIRGTLSAAIFEINNIQASAGTLGVYPDATKISAGFSTNAIDTTFYFWADDHPDDVAAFVVDDVVYGKHASSSGVITFEAEIDVVTPGTGDNAGKTYYDATLRAGSASTSFPEGMAIVMIGHLGETHGQITLSADGAVGYTPNITLATETIPGTWASHTPVARMRFGNLYGSWDYGASNVYGVVIGKYASGSPFLSWDETDGLRMVDYNTTMFQLKTNGAVYIGDQTDQYIRIQSSEIRFYDGTTDIGVFTGSTLRVGQYADNRTRIVIDDADGVRVIQRASSVDKTVFQADINGDVTFGSPAASKATILFDESTGRLLFRSNDVTRSYFENDGVLTFVDIAAVVGPEWRPTVGGSLSAFMAHYWTTPEHELHMAVPDIASKDGFIKIMAGAPTGYASEVELITDNNDGLSNWQNIVLHSETGNSFIQISSVGRVGLWGSEVLAGNPMHCIAGLTVETTYGAITEASDGWINVSNGVRVGGGSAGAPTYSFQANNDTNTGMYRSGENWCAFATGGNYRGGFTQTGLYLHETSNAHQSYGITIMNNSANDGFSIKHGSVAHGMTDIVETDTYYAINVANTTYGGFRSFGLTASIIGQQMISLSGSSNGGRATTAQGGIILQANYKSGAGSTFMPADSNLVVIRDYTSCRFVFDKEGTLHCDATISQNAWDEHDDAQLIRALEINRPSKGLIKDQFDDWLMYNREDVERLGIATFNDDTDGSVFINLNKLTYLQNGAIWQLHKKVKLMEQALLDAGIDLSLLN